MATLNFDFDFVRGLCAVVCLPEPIETDRLCATGAGRYVFIEMVRPGVSTWTRLFDNDQRRSIERHELSDTDAVTIQADLLRTGATPHYVHLFFNLASHQQ